VRAGGPTRRSRVTSISNMLATDAPNSPHRLLKYSPAEYLVLVAENDDLRAPQEKETVRTALAAAGRPHKVEVYPGAAHGWTEWAQIWFCYGVKR